MPRRVGGETSRFVEWIWFARGRIAGVRERIAPTGSTVAAVVLGDPIRQTQVGQGTALVAETGFLIGRIGRSSTSPWARRSALGSSPPRSVADPRSGRTGDATRSGCGLAGGMAEGRWLAARAEPCRTPAEALDVVEDTLSTPEPFDRHAFARCEAAVRQLSAEPTPSGY